MEARRPLSARLPPSLTTVGRLDALTARAGARSRRHRVRAALELLDAHQHRDDALVGEAALGDARRQRLDEIDVPGGDDGFTASTMSSYDGTSSMSSPFGDTPVATDASMVKRTFCVMPCSSS